MKYLIFIGLLLGLIFPLSAQTFDSTSYKEHYKTRLNSHYYTESLSDADKMAGLSKAWAEAKFNFANFDLVPDLNWDSLYHAYIPKAIVSNGPEEYFKVLADFYRNLHDGHSAIFPPQNMFDEMFANLPVRTQMMDDKLVITDVFSDQYPGLQRGQVITHINGKSIDKITSEDFSPFLYFSTTQDSIAKLHSHFLFRGNKEKPIHLELVDTDGTAKKETVFRQSNEGLFKAPGEYRFEIMEDNIGYLFIHTFNEADVLDFYEKVMPEILETNALIIDIRKNGGGNSNNGFELIGYLTDQPFYQAVNIKRTYTPVERAWGNYPDKLDITHYDWKPTRGILYEKPVALLIGPDTYSAAEDFTVGFKSISRGTIIGQATGGSTGQPLFFNLPMGGMGFVCAKRDLMADRQEFVGKGIQPDITVSYSYQNFINGKDEAIEKALEVLQNNIYKAQN
ncbi:MAG TPA: S41 family peptidase [Anditalea sp.]|nr:S41 family peptidase [Anditalea sp.]